MITLKSAPNGQKHAAYSGECRIGYIDVRERGGFVWHVYVVAPTGGSYMGIADDLETAKRDVAAAFASWCEAAGLNARQ